MERSRPLLSAALGAVAGAVAVFLLLSRRLAADREELRVEREKRAQERKGRTWAERQLREAGTRQQMEAGWSFRAIGTASSCYKSRCGTPRQGMLVNSSRAVIQLSIHVNPGASLDGLDRYSHLWVLYVFHQNTNVTREASIRSEFQRRSAANEGQKDVDQAVPPWQGLKMKIRPPRHPDPNFRCGVFACRTPHRPNPIGLSLCRVVKVDRKRGEVTVAGLDVVDGSPILDIKPYHPLFESVADASEPDWVTRSYEETMLEVHFSDQATKDMLDAKTRLKGDSSPFESWDVLEQGITSTLSLDIRSPHQKSKAFQTWCTDFANRRKQPADQCPLFTGDLWFHKFHVWYSLVVDEEAHQKPPGQDHPPFTVRVDSVLLEERQAPDVEEET